MHESASADHTSWMSRSACLHADPELFFPAVSDGRAEEAKLVCRRCLVRDECLAYAVATRQKYGVWGGATEGERRAMRRWHRGVASPARPGRPSRWHAAAV